MLEMKLDVNTMFEWQKESQSAEDIPPYGDLLDFINLRAQASEAATSDGGKKSPKDPKKQPNKVGSYTGNVELPPGKCISCKSDKHPLYTCSQFKSLSHEDKVSLLKSNNMCLNCLRSGHFVKGCKSLHRCRMCQKPHHTLLHLEDKTPPVPPSGATQSDASSSTNTSTSVLSHATTGLKSDLLLMTCRVLVESPDGFQAEARALLDSGSSASFVSERLAQSLHLPRSGQNTRISGVAGFVRNSSQPITTFHVSSLYQPSKRLPVTAVIVPRVTTDLPLQPIKSHHNWNHLSGIQLADPGFGQPAKIDLLLGVEIYAEVILHGRRSGDPDSPVAFETLFGWVLAGNTNSATSAHMIVSHHSMLQTGDDLLRQFWEVEKIADRACHTTEESAVLDHFKTHHTRLQDGRFLVPLPMKTGVKPLGESRS